MMKTLVVVLAICALGQSISVDTQEEANQLADKFLKFVESNQQYDSAPLPDLKVDFQKQLTITKVEGVVALEGGRISGIGHNPHRHGKTTLHKTSDRTLVRVSVHLMGVRVNYQKASIKSKDGSPMAAPGLSNVQNFSGLLKDITAILTLKIDRNGALTTDDIDFKKVKETDFDFGQVGQRSPLIASVVKDVVQEVKKIAYKAITQTMERAAIDYGKQH